MGETRERLASYIRAHPGVHFRGLVRALDLAPGQVQYHLRTLTGADRVVSMDLGDRTHYYAPTYDRWEQTVLALLRRETAADIVAVLLRRGSTHPQTVAEELDIARSTVEWHLDDLVAHDVVTKRKDQQNHVRIELATPEDTVALLREADPTLLDQMVDRFSRLVDRLLESPD